MSNPHIRMYCTSFCPYCTRASTLLKNKGVEFEKIDASTAEVWRQMEVESNQSTVPQIFVGELHLGGCDDIYALERAGQLDAILSGEVTTLE
ncbi:MAG: glutaredoxin 3 [Gammaproteobacteria bacterium]|nr:glutaredoxin 3 [Gammaproteobacteria bacterium]